jgi:antitoxin HicB
MAANVREYEVVLQPEEEGGFSVSVPDLPGCWTQGETREEALAMAKEAIEGYLESLKEAGQPIPQPQRERVTVEA